MDVPMRNLLDIDEESPLLMILAENARYERRGMDSSPGTPKSRAVGYLEYLSQLSVPELSSYKTMLEEDQTTFPGFKRYKRIIEFYVNLGSLEGALKAPEAWENLKLKLIPKEMLADVLKYSLRTIDDYATLSGTGTHEKADELRKSYSKLSSIAKSINGTVSGGQ